MPLCGFEPHRPPLPEVPGAVEHVSLPTITPDIDEEADGALLHFRSMTNLLEGVP
jgi:hypothetical protein